MRHVFVSVLAVILSIQLSGQTKSGTIPRTPDGHPDLQGIWTNQTLTRLERPKELEGNLTLTEEEARAFEKGDLEAGKDPKDGKPLVLGDAVFAGANDGYNVVYIDRGSELARVDGVKRSSLIIDPPDGKVPPLTSEARQKNTERARNFNRFDNVKDRPVAERCIIGFGSTSGPPMLPVLYNNYYEIVQTPEYVMILVEMVHDVRIIRMNGTHAPSNVRQWLGDSVGHWEGDTLVVDTTNFNNQTRFRGSSENLHVIERFQRVGSTILYRATIDDPTTFTKTWSLEYPFVTAPDPRIFEYACHEGNYAMSDILSGARKEDAK